MAHLKSYRDHKVGFIQLKKKIKSTARRVANTRFQTG